jgi:hypothetical protein
MASPAQLAEKAADAHELSDPEKSFFARIYLLWK